MLLKKQQKHKKNLIEAKLRQVLFRDNRFVTKFDHPKYKNYLSK